MTREYEVVYIFDSALEDDAINEKLSRFHKLVVENPEEVTLDLWGRRQLAYKIKNRDTGFYVVARITTNPETLPEFERALKLDDGVLRWLVSLHEHELGAPPSSEDDDADGRGRRDDDDDEDDDEEDD